MKTTKKATSTPKLRLLVMFLCSAMLSLTACSDALESEEPASDVMLPAESDAVDDTEFDDAEEEQEQQEEEIDAPDGPVDPCPGGFFSGSRCVRLDPDRDPDVSAQKPANPLAGALHVVNAYRRQQQQCGSIRVGPVADVRLSLDLIELSQAHAHDMAARGMVDFMASDGTFLLDNAGFRSMSANIGSGFVDTADAIESWLSFDTTCNGIMSGATHMGIGYAEDEAGNSYWAFVLGQN